MFVLRCCAVIFLATFVSTHEEKCGHDSYGRQAGYVIPIQDIYIDLTDAEIDLPFEPEKCGCYDVVGSYVKVCAYDDEAPDVHLVRKDTAFINRFGARGEARVQSHGYCSHPLRHSGLGAPRLTPKVVPTDGKKPKHG